MVAAGFVDFKFDYSDTKNLPIGHAIISEVFSAGGYLWRVHCYPRGAKEEHKENVLLYLRLASKSENVEAFVDVFMLRSCGSPSYTESWRFVHVFQPNSPSRIIGFVKRSDLELPGILTNGMARFMCGVIVVPRDPTPLPPPDIGMHLGGLLDSALGSDVSFIVDGETFPAHRAVLAARSPVFKAEVFGLMADATMSTVTLQDIEPAAFKLMLRLADKELGDSVTDMLQHLLAAADRYALDRLKLICSRKLIGHISVDTVGSILVFAETYNCPELKNSCLDFFAVEKNFKEAAFSDGFATLLQKFPALAAELRRRFTGLS